MKPDVDLGEGITFIPAFGHSPAQIAIVIETEGRIAVFGGDVAHNPMQMERPEWSAFIDFDPVQSAETRGEIFSRFADSDAIYFGAHFPHPGRIRRNGDGFHFEPLLEPV